MGTWEWAPWDNDGGADWFGDMFERTELDRYIRRTLESADSLDGHEEIRAAASMVIFLGRTYVWPIGSLDDDLELAASKLEAVLDTGEVEDAPELTTAIRDEIQELRSRIKGTDAGPSPEQSRRKWWELWKPG